MRRRRIGFGKSCGRSGKLSRRRLRVRRLRLFLVIGMVLGIGG